MRYLLSLIFICFLLTACNQDSRDYSAVNDPARVSASESAISYSYVSKDELDLALKAIPELSSLILYRNGEIIKEKFANGGAGDRPLNIKSASKSVLSALTGIALNEGYIESLDEPIAKFLPDYFGGLDDSLKHRITVRHLLTMSSGLRSTSFRNYGAWVVSRDWVGAALRGEQMHPPGSTMTYSTGDTHILSAVLTAASGMSTRQLAEQYLFTPMGQRIGGWDRDPQGIYFGGNNMALSPYSLLEFGKLYLNNGSYNGQQLLDPEWIQSSLTPHHNRISFNNRRHDYGYLWWRNTFAEQEVWFAWGYGGQYLFIVPDLKSVIVLTGNPDTRIRGMNNRIYALLESHIIPYIAGSETGGGTGS